MRQPLVAIVGSASAQREAKGEYDPPMRDVDAATRAAQELGRALAANGLRLLVYSSDPMFIEADVVAAYLSERPNGRGLIEVRYPAGVANPAFDEQKILPGAFRLRPDPSPLWEVSFYRSLADADGVLFLGGGYSTAISGQVTIAMRLPMLAIRSFGGGATTVWKSLAPSDFPTDGERNAMGEDWPVARSEEHADRLVRLLLAQIQRREQEAHKQRMSIAEAAVDEARKETLVELEAKAVRWSPWSAGLMGVTLASLPLAFWPAHIELWLLLLLPFLAGGVGALTKSIASPRSSSGFRTISRVDVALGLVAGGMASLLFVAVQLFNYPAGLGSAEEIAKFAEHGRKLMVLNTAIGFIAGLTWERVFGKLSSVDVVNTDVLTQALAKGAGQEESKNKDNSSVDA